MGDQSDEPLPPGVQSLPPSSFHNTSSMSGSNSRSNIFPLGLSDTRKVDAGEEAIMQPHEKTDRSNLQYENFNDIEAAVQTAVLHEQDIATQKIFQSQRGSSNAREHLEHNIDILLGRHDPNALKAIWKLEMDMVCLVEMLIMVLRYITKKRFLMAELNGESGQKSESNDLPEYLKKKLRARGILKDNQNAGYPSESENRLDDQSTQSTQSTAPGNLPPGWIEARDPENGAVIYHHSSSGKSRWEKPIEVAPTTVVAPSPPPDEWIEAFDETTGT